MDNNTFKNYKSMSMEQLGSSLLGQKAARGQARRRRSRKDEKIQKLLAILLGGQAVFQDAVKGRLADLKELQSDYKLNQKQVAEKAQIIGKLAEAIPTRILNAENPYAAYTQDRNAQRNLQAVTNPIASSRIEMAFGKEALAERGLSLESDLDQITDGPIAEWLLTRQKDLVIDGKERSPLEYAIESAEEFLGTEGDREETIDRLTGLSLGKLDQMIAKNKKSIASNIDSRASWLNFPGLIKDMFNKDAQNGTVFRSMLDSDVLDKGFSSSLEKINFGDFITPNYDKVIETWESSINPQTIGEGREQYRSTDVGSRMNISMGAYKRELQNEAKTFVSEQLAKDPNYDRSLINDILETKFFSKIREVQAAEDTMFGDNIDLEEGKGTLDTYRDAFSTLRTAFDVSDEFRDSIGEAYNINVDSLSAVQLDNLTTRIIFNEAFDLADSVKKHYEEGMLGKGLFNRLGADYDINSLRAGKVKLYQDPENRWYVWDGNQESALDRQSNFTWGLKSSANKAVASLLSPISGISQEGEVQLSPELNALIETTGNSSIDSKNAKAYASIISKELNRIYNQEPQGTEFAFQAILEKNKKYKDEIVKY